MFKVEFVGKTSPVPLNDSQPKVHVLRKQRGREATWCQLHQAEAPGLVLQGSQKIHRSDVSIARIFLKFSNSSGRFLALSIETLVCTLDPSAATMRARKLLCFKLVAELLRHPPADVGALDMS